MVALSWELGLFFLAYLVGSIPSGYWFAKWFFGVDVTKVGSGNIGATNVSRALGDKRYFFLIFFFDFIKAYGILFLFRQAPLAVLFACAVLLLVGNGYSLFLRFKGGKGIATMLGILAFFFPKLFASYLVIWLLVLAGARKVGLASLVAALSLIPAYVYFFQPVHPLTLLFLFFIVVWVFVRHKQNLKKLFGVT